MPRFFATFGTGQEYAGCYVEILAEDHHTARVFMIKAHGTRWSSVYDEADFDGQIEKWGLMKLCTVQQRPCQPNAEAFFDVVRENRHVRD